MQSWEKSEFEIGSAEADIDCEPGEVVYTGLVSPKSLEWNDSKLSKYHFMVRANCDEGEPIYISKFGSKGPVVAHSLGGSLGFYPANFIGLAGNFKMSSAKNLQKYTK